MLRIITLALGDYQTNTYIVSPQNASRCVLIDPGYEPQTILDTLTRENLKPEAVLLTHGHFDHVGAVQALFNATGCDLWSHEDDYALPANPTTAFFYPLAGRDLPRLRFCREGQVITAAGLEFTVMHTPGHTPGSLCYLCEDAMFCGDTLFAGSCGRINLPGGDRKAMLASLQRLAQTDGAYRIYPGHGSSASLEQEQQKNPYLAGLFY